MAIPTRAKQIEAVATLLEKFLDAPEYEEATTGDVAKKIIDGIYDMWTRDVESASFPLVVGKAFKTPMATKVYHVAWIGEAWRHGALREAVWVVSADSDYGTLTDYDSPLWRIVFPSNAKAGAPGASDAGWKVGDLIAHSWGQFKYEILAVGVKANLIRRIGTDDIRAEPSSMLEKYYRKVKK